MTRCGAKALQSTGHPRHILLMDGDSFPPIWLIRGMGHLLLDEGSKQPSGVTYSFGH